MFTKLCIDYLASQIAKSVLSERDKNSFKNFLRIISSKLEESKQDVYDLDELEKVGG